MNVHFCAPIMFHCFLTWSKTITRNSLWMTVSMTILTMHQSQDCEWTTSCTWNCDTRWKIRPFAQPVASLGAVAWPNCHAPRPASSSAALRRRVAAGTSGAAAQAVLHHKIVMIKAMAEVMPILMKMRQISWGSISTWFITRSVLSILCFNRTFLIA